MTKILVADDNSNVQRTVTQALSQLNVEVVAVNNGQAAVRKLAEFSPDLVLADIFMPVRNGYEVCEFVKKNAATAHVPVVLLAGAFDPLDEREAQRVGADGILKKPFIPPDPLVNMVKTLLERAVVPHLEMVSVSKSSEVAKAASSMSFSVPAAAPSPSEDTLHDALEFAPAEIPARERLSFDDSDQPIAFSSLLEFPGITAPGAEPEEKERKPSEERSEKFVASPFWHSESRTPSDAEITATHMAPFEQETPAAHLESELTTAAEVIDASQPAEPLELVRDEVETTSSSVVDTDPIVLDPSKYASLTVSDASPPELVSDHLEWIASTLTAPEEPLQAAIPETDASTEPVAEISHVPDVVETSESGPPMREEEPVSAAPEIAAVGPETAFSPDATIAGLSPNDTADLPWFARRTTIATAPAVQSLPDAIAVLESALLNRAASVPFHEPAPLRESVPVQESIPVRETVPVQESVPASKNSAEDTVPSLENLESGDVAATASIEAPSAPAPNPADTLPSSVFSAVASAASEIAASSKAAAPAPSAGSPDPELVEAIVQRVLDKMRPQVLDIITREFLRPIVQTLVNREIDKH